MFIPFSFIKRNKSIYPPKTYTNVHRNFIHNNTNYNNLYCPPPIYKKLKYMYIMINYSIVKIKNYEYTK